MQNKKSSDAVVQAPNTVVWQTLRQSATILEVCRQRVPINCAGDHEVSGAAYCSCSVDRLLGISRSQMPSAGHRWNWHAVFGQIHWCQPTQAFVCSHCWVKPDTLTDGQPILCMTVCCTESLTTSAVLCQMDSINQSIRIVLKWPKWNRHCKDHWLREIN